MKSQGLILLLIIIAISASEHHLRDSNLDPAVIGIGMENIASMYQKLVSLFGVSVKKEITHLVSEKGFEFFDSCSQMIIYSNFNPAGLPRLKKLLITKWDADEKGRETIATLFELIELTVRNQWTEHDVIFQRGSTGEMVYASLYSFQNDDDLFTFIIIDSRAHFRLNKELYLIKTTKSFGKIASSTNTQIIYKDRDIETEDIDSLMYFLQIVAYKQIAKNFNLQLNYPVLQ